MVAVARAEALTYELLALTGQRREEVARLQWEELESGTISGVEAVYQRRKFLPERQAALDLWGAHVSQLLGEISHDPRMDLKIVA